MMNLVQHFSPRSDASAAAKYLSAIEALLNALPDYEFNTSKSNFDVWEFVGGSATEEQGYVNHKAAQEVFSFSNGDWSNVSDITRIGETLPPDGRYQQWYIDACADRKYYKLRPEALESLREAFAPVIAMYNTIIAETDASEKADAQRRERLKATIASCETTKQAVTDEGGPTNVYHHVVTLLDGATLRFKERNLFDFGRSITPDYRITPEAATPGGRASMVEGVWAWKEFDEKRGWYVVRPLTENEIAALEYLVEFGGFVRANIRM